MAFYSFFLFLALSDFLESLLAFDFADFTDSVDFLNPLAELDTEGGLSAC